MNKEISIRFYQVECPEGVRLENVLSRIRRKNARNRTVSLNSIPTLMAKLRKDDDYYQGEVIKIRMDGLPGVVRMGADEINDLELQADQGLGEEAAFLYHIPTGIIALQLNISGVRESAFCRYISNFGDTDQPFLLRPVLRQDAFARYENMQFIRNFEIKLASGFSTDILEDSGGNELFSDILRHMRTYSSGSIDLKMSVGSPHDRTATLDDRVRTVIEFFRNLVSSGVADVQKLKVSGKQNELLSTEVVDLIDDVMKERVKIEMSENRRYLYSARKDAVRNAWDKNKEELIARFSS